ncbi:FKBP-type peptidyl-prolyl cis-trans isomerase [Marivirga harenae]|uniref:FKBP-type peptidyl-prolyl cis-trans isomerase n=1 Tax=Marivirga harenae TaxID=2010992 RepID=UPI0026E064F3|nr:FKBP-type peptidyl-prolyl cis-trans isomerase [Marivirga harenae]WKV13445.1 FKBP-type peptidyl-prolyl cis-trans isomerase [Marivirga harenae]
MNNFKNLAFGLLSLILIVACDSQKQEKTEDGVEYVLIESGEGGSFEEGDFAIFSIKIVDSKDSVMIDSERDGELPVQINDSILSTRGPLFSILKELQIGDSIKTKLSASQVLTEGFRQPISQDKDKAERLTVFAKTLEKLDTAGFMEWQQQKRVEAMEEMQKKAEEQKGIDDQLIKDFLAQNNIEANRTESGLFYIVTQEGSGEQPQQGDSVSVNYVGKLMDGTVFDTSYEELAQEAGVYNENRTYSPFSFPIGKRQVIAGWDEGLMLLNEGSKATFYIPSGLAYGQRGSGRRIPPNSPLIFDVELVEVK